MSSHAAWAGAGEWNSPARALRLWWPSRTLWLPSSEHGFIGVDAWRVGQEVFELGEHGEGIGLIEVDVEGLFGRVAGEEEEHVTVGRGTVEAVIEGAGLGA